MMNYIFGGMILLSFVFSAFNGRLGELSNAALEQAGKAVELTFSLVGVLCLWSGLMKLRRNRTDTGAGKSAFSDHKTAFQRAQPGRKAMQAVCMNMIANFLGLGNAATPLGIRAICAMKKRSMPKKRLII
jgi:spore maturation protein A